MAPGFSNWFLILYPVLLLTLCSCGNGVSWEMHENHMHSHLSSHIDGSTGGFFSLDDLFLGHKMLIHFPKYKMDPSSSSSPPFLKEADTIPFSLTELPNLLELFSFSQGSPQAKTMEETLRHCESKPIRDETKSCVTSLESMLDFVGGILGSETPIKVLNTKLPKSSNLFQNYTILEVPEEVPSRKTTSCHGMGYPYAVFSCHSSKSETKVFKVSFGGDEDGIRVEAVVLCHMDTSTWNADHIAFQSPAVKHGSPACHFFVGDNLLWVSSAPSGATGY